MGVIADFQVVGVLVNIYWATVVVPLRLLPPSMYRQEGHYMCDSTHRRHWFGTTYIVLEYRDIRVTANFLSGLGGFYT